MDKLRLGVIGVGSVVREIYQHLYFKSDFSPMLDIAAIADPNESMLAWFGDTFGIAKDRRFTDYRPMLEKIKLDAVQVNTPDHLHAAPTIAAMKAGLDVLVPKPAAATIKDAHAMIETARSTNRLMGIDFHKREDPRIKEVEARYRSGRYGEFQVAVWYMLDKLFVADPNHQPRFFASPDFAEKNTPISFLTVHMADAFMKIIGLKPVEVRAAGYSHKMSSLKPIAVKGYDLVDTEVRFENGGTAHIITGWHLPNTAYSTTVQSSRLICSNGLIDMGIDTPGIRELHPDGVFEVNPLFKNFEKSGLVTGYGISSPGRIYQKFLAGRNGKLDAKTIEEMMTPAELGFYTTLVLEAAEESLKSGTAVAPNVSSGPVVKLADLVKRQLGPEAVKTYGL